MRATVLLVAAVVVLGAGAPLASAAPASQSASDPVSSVSASTSSVQENETADNETENETAPGARLAGVVGVQGAEVSGEVEQRSFGLQVAAAHSNASRASVVANQSEQLATRLAELRTEKESLMAANANDTISQGKYRAEMATLSARISTLERLTNSTAETARGLPAEALAAKGVNASKIRLLQTSASNLSGPEVAAIARNISGPPVSVTRGPPDNVTRGPPGNETAGPPGNKTAGPPSNKTTGPNDNTTTGPGDKTTGPPSNKTTGPTDDPSTGQSGDDTTTGPPDRTTTGPGDNSTPGSGPGNGPPGLRVT